MKRPLVACLVVYAWVSELCASSSDRQLGAFNMSIPLINTGSDEVNPSFSLSQEIDLHIINISSLCTSVWAYSEQITIFLSTFLFN